MCALLSTLFCLVFLVDKSIVMGSEEGMLWSTYQIIAEDDTDELFKRSISRADGLEIAFAIMSHTNAED